MASNDVMRKRKMSQVVVKQNATLQPLPWEDIAPIKIAEWLDVFSKANNTTREILLASILPTTACLMGNTKVKVECKLRAENVNLFLICLSPPGSGKSPAFHNACSHPVRIHVEETKSTQLFADEFTEAGLFQQLKASDGHKAIVGKEEVSQFFDSILSGAREKSKLDVERLIQLYDGATWVYTKGNSQARQVVDNPGVSIAGYSQPDRFFLIYEKLKERKDGAIDRIMIYQPKPHRLTSAETKEHIGLLNNSKVKDLRIVYEDIYSFCHNEQDVINLRLDDEGNELYEKFVDEMAATLNKQWEEHPDSTEDVSKADRHVIRLAATLHVLYDQLEKRLSEEKSSPPPVTIAKETLQQAICLEKYFSAQRKVLDQLTIGESNKKSRNAGNTVANAILSSPGPFTTVQVVQKSLFSGKNRPTASQVVETMDALSTDEAGFVKTVDRTTVFYKALPNEVKEEIFTRYGSEKSKYLDQFTKRPPIEFVSKERFNKLLRNAPKVKEVKDTYYITEEI